MVLEGYYIIGDENNENILKNDYLSFNTDHVDRYISFFFSSTGKCGYYQ